MINPKSKEDCCGCGACFDICNKQAIDWTTDLDGFSYPVVDTNRCVKCGLCEKVCPIINSDSINNVCSINPVIYGVYHKDDEIRFTSTSGGAFWGLAEPWIKNGGYVAGAIFTEQFKVKHFITNSIEGLTKIKGSKYTQSDCRGLYKEIAELLKQGKRVLATGTPCQMAALKQFIKQDHENLLLVNVICHSVASPLAFAKYVEYLEKRYKSKMVAFHPKNKEFGGWHNFAFKANFANGKQYVAHFEDDYYTQIFVGGSNLLTRPSCFDCRFKNVPQPTDITIGDLWGVETFDSSFDSPKGVSALFLNTEKGKEYFKTLDSFVFKEYDINTVIFKNKRNASIRKSVARPDNEKRKALLEDIYKMDFEHWVKKYFLPRITIKRRILMVSSKVKCYIKRIIYK